MTDYELSSHISSWMFTPQDLEVLRVQANLEACTYLQGLERLEDKEEALASLEPPQPKCFAKCHQSSKRECPAGDESTTSSYLTSTEEQSLVKFYSSKIFSLVGQNAPHFKLKRDVKVASTAALLFRRFYLSNSVMVFDPKAIMVACAFLATKVEDVTVEIQNLEEGTKRMDAHVSIDEIIKSEVQLVKGIDFDFTCYHPFKTVLAYTEDLRTFLRSTQGKRYVNRDWVGGEDLRPIYDEAHRIVEDAVDSDVPLLAGAGKIGLAAMMLANQRLLETGKNIQMSDDAEELSKNNARTMEIDFKGYMKCRFQETHSGQDVELIWQEMTKLRDVLGTLKSGGYGCGNQSIDMVQLKVIHKKLKKCRIWGQKSGDKKKKRKKKRRRIE